MAGAAAYSGYFTAVRRVAKGAAAQVLEQLSHMGITVALFTWIAPQGLEPACLALVIGGALSEVCSFFAFLYSIVWTAAVSPVLLQPTALLCIRFFLSVCRWASAPWCARPSTPPNR